MHAYTYDRQTFIYSGKITCEPSPMEEGEYLLPAFATDLEVPSFAANEIAIFDVKAGKWTVAKLDVSSSAPGDVRASVVEALGARTASYKAVTTSHLQAVAMGMGFDSIEEAVGYADEPSDLVYQAQGRALRAWRSVVWRAFERIVAEVDAGVVPAPTERDALIAMLPEFVPPAPPAEPQPEPAPAEE